MKLLMWKRRAGETCPDSCHRRAMEEAERASELIRDMNREEALHAIQIMLDRLGHLPIDFQI